VVGSWELPEGFTDSLAFHDAGRLLLVRTETRSGKNPPFLPTKPSDDPRVIRLYDLLRPTPTKAFKEITDFDQHVFYIAVAPDAAYFVVEGIGTVAGRPKLLVQVFRGPDGALLDSVNTRIPLDSGGTVLPSDPRGRVFGVPLGQDGRFTLLELPSLKTRTVTEPGLYCIGPGGTRWGVFQDLSPGQPALALFDESQPDRPLVRILMERGPVSFRFTPDGQSVVWCNSDGTVSVCDLKVVNQRLTAVDLVW
jgi:hypothetical protein